MTDATNDQPIFQTAEVELHIFGSPSEVEAQAAQIRQFLKVVDESDVSFDPDADDPHRVRKRLTVETPLSQQTHPL